MEASRPGTTTFIHVVQNLSKLLETARWRLISFLAASLLAAQLNIKKEHFLCAAIVILHWQLRSQEILHSDKCRKTNQVESAHTYNCLNVNV